MRGRERERDACDVNRYHAEIASDHAYDYLDGAYLIVTIICEYKILRFWDCDDFAGTNFCDFMKSS